MRTQMTAWFHHTDLETPMSAIPITVTGTIATEPSARTLPSGRACASFRLAVNHWRVDKNTGEFVTDGTSWFGVDCYGDLASNSAMSLNTGAAVIISGSLRNREWATEERSGISPTVVAEHIGPDLRYGTAHYKRAKAADRSQSTAGESNSESSGSNDSGWSALGPAETPPESESDGDTDRGDIVDPASGADADIDTGAEDDPIAQETARVAAPF